MRDDILKIVKRVHEIFIDKGLTLSVAESCTGGLISHCITSLPGASLFFQAGVVSYSSEAKEDILGVSTETIKEHGVISMETAVEMAEKVRALSKTDYALSTTGNLGPAALEGKERGLVFIAMSRKSSTVTRELHLKGGREANMNEAALSAIRLLIEDLE